MRWTAVAAKYPKLKINLAHFGSSEEWKHYRAGKPNTHVQQSLDMMRNHKNVFADFSFACTSLKNLEKILELITSLKINEADRKVYREKILYGSDFFLNQTNLNIITVIENMFKTFKDDKEIINDFCVRNPYRFLFQNPV